MRGTILAMKKKRREVSSNLVRKPSEPTLANGFEGLPVPRNEQWRRRVKLTRAFGAFRNSPGGAAGREGKHGVHLERGHEGGGKGEWSEVVIDKFSLNPYPRTKGASATDSGLQGDASTSSSSDDGGSIYVEVRRTFFNCRTNWKNNSGA